MGSLVWAEAMTDFPELEKQVAVFREHREKLAREHHGKYVVVHGEKIRDYFDVLVDAIVYARKHGFKRGEFSIHRCVSEDEEPPIILRSRVRVG